MIIGIDVGGTHTDGVLVKRENSLNEKSYKIAAVSKVNTEHDNLMKSILTTLDILIKEENNDNIERIVLSTTLATNIIQEEKYEPVGLVLIPGPGLNPEYLKYGEENINLSGYIDHRGQEVKTTAEQEITAGLDKLQAEGINKVAVVGKFSVRNPVQENRVKEIIDKNDYNFGTVTLGHQLSGSLNFHRRVITAYFNTAISSVHKKFTAAVKEALEERDIRADIYLLKCDGGTIPLTQSLQTPIRTVNSGPAASIMGTMVLSENSETAVVLDIGGTTTDIGLFIDGEPAFMPRGIAIKGLPTLVRGLYTISISLGGDSEIRAEEGRLKIGPQRCGPAAACGGSAPTPTDALLVLGHIKEKKGFDLKRAKRALSSLLAEVKPELYPQYKNKNNFDLRAISEIITAQVVEIIDETISAILNRMRNQPVYTISELLLSPELKPELMIGMGGPASSLLNLLGERLGYRTEIIPYSKTANALGAAFAHPTLETTVRADTAAGYLDIVEAGIHRKLKNKKFSAEQAEDLAREWTRKRFGSFDNQEYPVEITDRESFNVIRGFRTLGKIIEVKAQIKPGQIARLRGGNISL